MDTPPKLVTLTASMLRSLWLELSHTMFNPLFHKRNPSLRARTNQIRLRIKLLVTNQILLNLKSCVLNPELTINENEVAVNSEYQNNNGYQSRADFLIIFETNKIVS